MSQPFYRAFEDRYRGSRETITQRLRAYEGLIAPLAAQAPARALDLGCGRGEWLELLGAAGFQARGIDLDEGMLAACRERGLDVQNMDALAALRAQPDGSLALVSAFHLVEHIPFELVQELIAQALRVLQPGGLLIMETPNPENLTVGASSFYMDPSHLHPLPPALLAFAAEHAGFARHKVLRLQEDPALHGDAPLGLITVLEGVSPDYSVVAQKAAAPDVLAPFDAAFAADYGITLGQLASRYEEQGARRHAEIHQALGRLGEESAATNRELARALEALTQAGHRFGILEQRIAQAEHRNGELAQRSAELERRSGEIEQRSAELAARIVHAEARADEMGQRVVDLLSSTSWKITAPLRRASDLLRRTRNMVREGRVRAVLRSRAKRALFALGGAVLRRPRLKRAALSLLRFTPALQARLQRMMYSQAANAVPPAETSAAPDDLSPRAARVYQALKQAQQARRNS